MRHAAIHPALLDGYGMVGCYSFVCCISYSLLHLEFANSLQKQTKLIVFVVRQRVSISHAYWQQIRTHSGFLCAMWNACAYVNLSFFFQSFSNMKKFSGLVLIFRYFITIIFLLPYPAPLLISLTHCCFYVYLPPNPWRRTEERKSK